MRTWIKEGVRAMLVLLFLAVMCEKGFAAETLPPELRSQYQQQLHEFDAALTRLPHAGAALRRWTDVAVFTKGVRWILTENEFHTPAYVRHTAQALQVGQSRLQQATGGNAPWETAATWVIHGYRSQVDGSLQPYACSIPTAVRNDPRRQWPLHIVLHGRNQILTEVSFIHDYEGKRIDPQQTWMQVEVFGRGNNAYRWAGETDVLEVLEDISARYPIDRQHVVLRGFSMGGAGAWHIGLHYPARWCSVGPGAGFVDFYEYQNLNHKLPSVQDAVLGIYDAVPYALNAFNVPVCTYGGELDKQLLASQRMEAETRKCQVPLKVLVGPGVGHKFEPKTYQEYLKFHLDQQARPTSDRRAIRFATRTLKYNQCDWLTIEEMERPYEECRVDGEIPESGPVRIRTVNAAALRIHLDLKGEIEIDGTRLSPGASQANTAGHLFQKQTSQWIALEGANRQAFESNQPLRKRHNLQGPIDDAFMEPFLCVKGTGKPWSAPHQAWADWTLARFQQEFRRHLRGEIRIVSDHELTPEQARNHHLILFGDPGSNSVLKSVLPGLPLQWTPSHLSIQGTDYDLSQHGVAMIYPHPEHRQRYVVLNSGHTFHAEDFAKSNAWLFPRLGDLSVLRFRQSSATGDSKVPAFVEDVVSSVLFDASWQFPAVAAPQKRSLP